jgi:hypothetical protein
MHQHVIVMQFSLCALSGLLEEVATTLYACPFENIDTKKFSFFTKCNTCRF